MFRIIQSLRLETLAISKQFLDQESLNPLKSGENVRQNHPTMKTCATGTRVQNDNIEKEKKKKNKPKPHNSPGVFSEHIIRDL